MNERLLVALSCGGEFVAALQIEAAILGRGRLPRWAAAALLCLLWAGSQVLWGTYVPYSPWALTFNALRMLAAAFFFGGGLLQKAFSVVVCGVVILGYGNTVGALAAGLNKMPMSEIWRLPQSILLYGVVLNALLYLGIRLLRRWIGAIDPVQKMVGTVYICLIALLNVILTNFGQDTDQYSYMVLICILLILATLVYFALFTMLSVRSTQASQTEARMKIEQERADALMESYQSQRRLTHEFTNHMGAVGFYLEQGDVEGARAYLASVSKAVAAGTAVVDTHNPLLDAVLSKEYRQAARSGVLLNFDLCDLARFPLRNAELAAGQRHPGRRRSGPAPGHPPHQKAGRGVRDLGAQPGGPGHPPDGGGAAGLHQGRARPRHGPGQRPKRAGALRRGVRPLLPQPVVLFYGHRAGGRLRQTER